MNLNSQQIDELKVMYTTKTSHEIAVVKGWSDALCRRVLSDHGISCPRREAAAKQRELIRRHWMHGEPKTIASYLGISIDALRMRVKRMHLDTPQTKMNL